MTIKEAVPVPQIDIALNNLHGEKYFTTLDLAAGYFQVPLDELSKQPSEPPMDYGNLMHVVYAIQCPSNFCEADGRSPERPTIQPGFCIPG